jgi:hypothetical protein
MFDPFKMYDEWLGMFTEDDEELVDTVFVTREIPEKLEDKFNALVDNMLIEYGYSPEEFDVEED